MGCTIDIFVSNRKKFHKMSKPLTVCLNLIIIKLLSSSGCKYYKLFLAPAVPQMQNISFERQHQKTSKTTTKTIKLKNIYNKIFFLIFENKVILHLQFQPISNNY